MKIDDDEEAKEYGIDTIPSLVFFEKKIPHVYEGDLLNEDALLGWLLHQKRHAEIPDITDEMLERLVENTPYLAVLFCKIIFYIKIYVYKPINLKFQMTRMINKTFESSTKWKTLMTN